MGTLGDRYGAAWKSPQADGGGYPPDGEHDVTVTRVVQSEINSKGEVVDPTFVFFLADEVGCGFKTYQTIKSEKALWRMKSIIKRLGLSIPETPDGILDSLRALEGRGVRIRVKTHEFNGHTMHDVDFICVVATSGAAYKAQPATTPTQPATAPQSAPAAPQYPPQQQQWQPAPWPAQPQPQYAPVATPKAPAETQYAPQPPQYPPQYPQQYPQQYPPQYPQYTAQPVTQATQPAPPGEAMGGDSCEDIPF